MMLPKFSAHSSISICGPGRRIDRSLFAPLAKTSKYQKLFSTTKAKTIIAQRCSISTSGTSIPCPLNHGKFLARHTKSKECSLLPVDERSAIGESNYADSHVNSKRHFIERRRYLSIFSEAIKQNRDKYWHNESFMKDSSPEEKDRWLKNILNDEASFRQNGVDGHYVFHESGLQIDSTAFLFVLKAWSSSNLNTAPQRCEEIISRMERIHAAAKAYQEDWNVTNNSNLKNERNENDVQKFVFHLQPTVECYNEVIRAWSNAKNPIVARAERWLDTMRRNRDYINELQKRMKGNVEGNYTQSNINEERYVDCAAIPNTESYNLFLSIVSKGHVKKTLLLRDNADKARYLLQEMIDIHKESGDDIAQPNTDSFNYVLRAITRSRSDVELTTKLMATLRLMESLQRESDNPDNAVVKPNTMTYCMAIDAFGISAYQKAFSSQKRKHFNENKVLPKTASEDDDFINEADPFKEIERAESILKYMHDLNSFGNVDVIPNNVAYNTIISAYSRISSEKYPDAPMQAESVLRRMIELSDKEIESAVAPDTRSYNTVIRCWANAKQNKSGIRAEWWLRKMWQDCEMSGVVPDVNTYNSVILAFLNIGQPVEAENLLKELLDMDRNNELRPNSESFALVIRAWMKYIKSEKENDVVQGCKNASKWLLTLLDKEDESQGYTTSPEVFSQMIQGIEFATRKSGDKTLLGIALEIFSKLQSSRHHLDAISYKCLLQIGNRTLTGPSNRKGRNKFNHTVIASCCEDGLLSKDFMSVLSNTSFQKNLGTGELRAIGEKYFSNWPLPNNWHRNVKPHHFVPSKKDCAIFLSQQSQD
mmetsp:Transcript_813/g.1286  ORF Transcript_813/g.1286 Transcript_813/m.1286 type:complete len:822 (-) Transcript_813:1477-3942(-)